MRRRRLGQSLTVIFLLTTGRVSSFVTTTTTTPPKCSQSLLYSAPPTAAAVTTADLEKMTIKELKAMLKESPLNRRGLLSKLKKKQDLIDFLQANWASISSIESTKVKKNPSGEALVVEEEVEHVEETLSPQKKQGPLSMPSIFEPLETASSASTSSSLPSTEKPGVVNKYSHSIFEKVIARYPPLCNSIHKNNDVNSNNDEDDTQDVRQLYHPMLRNATSSDMDLIFVGTASCTPGVTRGVACTALRLNWRRRSKPDDDGSITKESAFTGGTWLFDVGECTQLQVQRTSNIKPTKITKIFITHAHGDHSFGLPGILCLMGQDRDHDSPPVDIYGPEGLRAWLRVAIRYSVSRIVPPYRVHELKSIPMAPEWRSARKSGRFYHSLGRKHYQGKRNSWGEVGISGEDPESWITQCKNLHLEPSTNFGEIPGGRDIEPQYDHPKAVDGAPVWEVEDEDDVRVFAAPMSHGVPCVGYVVEEQGRPGRLRNDLVEPIVKRNIQALKDAGFQVPMKAMAVIKNLPEGSAFTFPDGTVVTQEEAVEPPREGRKVVICGDTCDARAIAGLAMDADIVVHEATNAYLVGLDKHTTLRDVTKDTMVHGHSTPQMAAIFAKNVRAKNLLLNHFSARYKGDDAIESIATMTRIEDQAVDAGDYDETNVAATWDFMYLPIPQR